MKTHDRADELNVNTLLFKFQRYWYLFVGAVGLALAFAYFKIQTTQPTYSFHSTILLADRATPGSRGTQELLTMDGQGKETKVEDEIGLLTSTSIMEQSLRKLDFSVSYYLIPNSWLNKLGNLQIREQYEDAAYRVRVDTLHPQVSGVQFFVEQLPNGSYHVHGKGENASVIEVPTGKTVNLLPEFEFDKEVKPGESVVLPNLSFTVNPAPGVLPSTITNTITSGNQYFFTINSLKNLAAEYQSKITVKPRERYSRVLDLYTKGSVASRELQFLNTLMETYIKNDLIEKNRDGRKTLEFINSQIAHVGDSLRRSEEALASFRAHNGIVDEGTQSNSGIQKLSDLESQRAQLIVTRRSYAQVLDALRSDPDGTGGSWASASIDNQVLNSQLTELSTLINQRAGYSVNANSDNPVVQVLEGKIQSRRQAILRSIAGQIRSTDASLDDLTRRIATVQGNINRMPENERQMARLRNISGINDRNYTFLMQKQSEASMLLATNVSDKKIVDRAQIMSSVPDSPNKNQIYLIALLAGLILPAGFVVLRERTKQTVQSADEIRNATNAPFLGIIAAAPKPVHIVRRDLPKSAVTESFRTVRVNLQYVATGPSSRIIGFTSSVSGEDKTFCCTNLAAELAMSGRRTVLIETDMRKPTLAGYFGFNPDNAGLSTYLSGECTLAEAMQKTEFPNLTVITSGPIPYNALELLEDPRFGQMITGLSEEYDYVIIDTPPIGLVSEYTVIRQHVGVTVFVVRHAYTNREMLGTINEMRQYHGDTPVYVLLNGVNYSATYEYRYKKQSAYYA
ncbi:exopolysaccharide transport family protein [Hymenobacter jejuensis]|uniref:non-specific protein-tyrosine kinase n=1 Tax=Hymenobacter jejuensis TaxID=2502781 RepID=A0A5B7ZV56_9BACT|nr:tyrosine-protein kinase [Hymenobacter jejuensis]QDA58878.1 polysaccharide biosynthesis tyrosine autokinase [Hymenobacter jejuensis]